MSATNLMIEPSEMKKIIAFVSKNILRPKLSEISYGMRSYIAERGKVGAAYKNYKEPSVGSISATTHIISPKALKSRIKPVIPLVFEVNKEGYSGPYKKYTKEDRDLYNWVLLNYKNMSGKNSILNDEIPLIVRAKDDYSGFNKPPLGAPERDYFGLGFKDFIINKNKYGLR